MAVATASDKISSNLQVTSYDFDPNDTAVTEIAWVDMRDSSGIMIQFIRTIGTGAVTFDLLANTESDGSGTDTVIKTHAVDSEPNAVGDYIFLEATADEIGAGGTGAARYVTARVSVATGTDEGVVSYIRTAGRVHKEGLTADLIA